MLVGLHSYDTAVYFRGKRSKDQLPGNKKGQAGLSFSTGGMRGVRSSSQDISFPGHPQCFGPGPNSQIPVEILDVELNGTKAQE